MIPALMMTTSIDGFEVVTTSSSSSAGNNNEGRRQSETGREASSSSDSHWLNPFFTLLRDLLKANSNERENSRALLPGNTNTNEQPAFIVLKQRPNDKLASFFKSQKEAEEAATTVEKSDVILPAFDKVNPRHKAIQEGCTCRCDCCDCCPCSSTLELEDYDEENFLF